MELDEIIEQMEKVVDPSYKGIHLPDMLITLAKEIRMLKSTVEHLERWQDNHDGLDD